MLEALTGTGLAASAGLNAYIPMATVALLARFTDLVTLPAGWDWLASPWAIGILAVLLVVEVVADKVPAVDSVNDVLQTAVRPAAGGITFGATSVSETVSVQDPSTFFTDNTWVSVLVGVAVALVVHATKALTRPFVNLSTMGLGAPVVSSLEDGFSVGLALVAIVLPVLVLLLLVVLALAAGWAWRQRVRRRGAPAGAAARGG